MARSIKSFNANDDVLNLIKEQNPPNVTEWINKMILKGHNSSKNSKEETPLLQNARVKL